MYTYVRYRSRCADKQITDILIIDVSAMKITDSDADTNIRS